MHGVLDLFIERLVLKKKEKLLLSCSDGNKMYSGYCFNQGAKAVMLNPEWISFVLQQPPTDNMSIWILFDGVMGMTIWDAKFRDKLATAFAAIPLESQESFSNFLWYPAIHPHVPNGTKQFWSA